MTAIKQTLRLLHPLGENTWHDGPVRIGRSPDNQLVINDESLSRHHAEINPTRNGWVVRDLQSANGLWFKGNRVPMHRIKNGDALTLGSVTISILEAEISVAKPVNRLRMVLIGGLILMVLFISLQGKEDDPAQAFRSPDAKVFEARIPPPPKDLTQSRAVEIAKRYLHDKERSGAAVAEARRALEWAKVLNGGTLPTEAEGIHKEVFAALDDRFQTGRVAYVQSKKLGNTVGAESAMRMLRETFPSDDPRSFELDKLERMP